MTLMSIGALAAGFAATTDTEFDPDSVTPGFEGFLMTGLLAAAVIGLGFVLVRRLRRNAYRHEVREEIEAELSARDAGDVEAAAGDDVAGGSAEPGAGDTPRG